MRFRVLNTSMYILYFYTPNVEHRTTPFWAVHNRRLMLLSDILAKVSQPNKYILISHKHKLIPYSVADTTQ